MEAAVAEIMIAAMAEELRGEVAVSAVTPMGLLAAILARETHAPDLALLATPESGQDALPFPSLSLGPFLADRQRGFALDLEDVFDAIFQDRFRIWISPAQIDRLGRANITCIGAWARPRVALVGARGIPEDSVALSELLFYLPSHSPRTLVAEVDFRSGAGYDVEGAKLLYGRRRTTTLVTELGVFGWDAEGNFHVRSLHPGVEPVTVVERTGFPVVVPPEVPTTRLPTADELAILRRLDPLGVANLELEAAKARERWLGVFAAERAHLAERAPFLGRRSS